MAQPTRTVRYECIGGPRDGEVVRVRAGARAVTLDDEVYRVRWFVKRDERGLRLWERRCLVWARHPAETKEDQPQMEDEVLSLDRARVLASRRAELVLEDSDGIWWLVRERDRALYFATLEERRRIAPAPRDWRRMSAAEVERLLHQAEAAL